MAPPATPKPFDQMSKAEVRAWVDSLSPADVEQFASRPTLEQIAADFAISLQDAALLRAEVSRAVQA